MLATAQILDQQLDSIFGQSMHSKRLNSLGNAVKGCIETSKLAIHSIGAGLATLDSLTQKHAIKQVDRLLSNPKLSMSQVFTDLVPYVVGSREAITVSLDWTEFDADDQSTLVLSMQTSHGRNTPLLWKTVQKSRLKDRRNQHERDLLSQLKASLPKTANSVLIVADRGFGSTGTFDFIEAELGFDYLIRFKGNFKLGLNGEAQQDAKQWLTPSGRTKTITDAELTAHRYPVAKVFCCRKAGMKDAWFLASNRRNLAAASALKSYAKRWGIETSFKDIKDYRFGMGMNTIRMRSINRRDRLFLISALTVIFLTLLGKAGDEVGLERYIKANTVKTRSYSFFRQGRMYYDLLPTMRDEWIIPLIEKFEYYLSRQQFIKRTLGTL